MSYDPRSRRIAGTFDLRPLLNQRGLSYNSQETLEKTLYPFLNKSFGVTEAEFYDLMAENEQRKRMRLAIFKQEKNFKIKGNAVDLDLTHEIQFAKSFEWYVSQLLLKEFSFFTAGYGVQVKDDLKGGDYDVLGFGLDLFVHIECKTGNPLNITQAQVSEFKTRTDFIGADIKIFYVDYNGLKEEHSTFLDYFNRAFNEDRIFKITKPDSGFEIKQVGMGPVFVIDTNKSSKDPIQNFREIFYIYFRMRSFDNSNSGYTPDIFSNYGYTVTSDQKPADFWKKSD